MLPNGAVIDQPARLELAREAVAKPKPRTAKKTFTGCWTCRRRKVKCDLTRPHCKLCERNNLPCEGYSIKLCWDGKGSAEHKRRLAGWVEFPPHMMYKFYEDIDSELNELQAKTPTDGETVIGGPFAVFQANASESPKRHKTKGTKARKPEPSPALSAISVGQAVTPGAEVLMGQSQSQGQSQGQDFGSGGNNGVVGRMDDVFYPGDYEANMNPFSHDVLAELGGFMDDLQTLFPPNYIEPIQDEPAEPEDVLFEPGKEEAVPWIPPDEPLLVRGSSPALTAQARSLLQHYENHVTPIMTMIIHLKNPWKTIYLPRAYSAIGDIVGRGHTSNERYTLLNSLLSVSAYHIRNKFPNGSAPYQHYADLAGKLEQTARAWLARCLHSDQPTRYKDLLVAVLTMFTLDLVKGGNSVTVPLQAAQKLVTLRCKRRPKLSRKAMILHRICVMLTLLSKATVFDIPEEEELDDQDWIYRTFDDIVLPRNGPEIERLGKMESRQKPLSYMNNATQLEEYFQQYSSFESHRAGQSPQSRISRHSAQEIMDGVGSNETWTQIPAEYEAVSTQLIHGMPDSLVHLFKQVMDVSRRALHERTVNNGLLSPELATKCTGVEAALASWKSQFELSRPTELLIPQVNESVMYHSLALHDALVLYHYRVAKDVKRDLLQQHVERIIGYLESIAAINDAAAGPQPVALPFFFPGFIGGCEILPDNVNLRRRYDRWYHEMRSTGVSSYKAATAVYDECNRLRSGGLPSNWWDVMRQINAYPILI